MYDSLLEKWQSFTGASFVFPVAAAALVLYPVFLILYQVWLANQQSKPPAVSCNKSVRQLVTAVVSCLAQCLLWPCLCAVPLALTCGSPRYRDIFPESWYVEVPTSYAISDYMSVKPLGLILGILAVVVGQMFTLAYYALQRCGCFGPMMKVQQNQKQKNFLEGLATHLCQPEGFALIGGYLSLTWMFGLMPASYYSFEGGINWFHVAAQLLLQDALQFLFHQIEHRLPMAFYRSTHKPHHRFVEPCLFDAFNGSPGDTLLMIVLPFTIVARIVPANVWSYMAFGSLYANWLVLIHSEYAHVWDGVFRMCGLGTAADHHVHHRYFLYNYGHLFMFWDKLLGTYRNPSSLGGSHFSKGI